MKHHYRANLQQTQKFSLLLLKRQVCLERLEYLADPSRQLGQLLLLDPMDRSGLWDLVHLGGLEDLVHHLHLEDLGGLEVLVDPVRPNRPLDLGRLLGPNCLEYLVDRLDQLILVHLLDPNRLCHLWVLAALLRLEGLVHPGYLVRLGYLERQ